MTKTISGYKELPNFVEQISLGEFLPAHYRIRVALIVQNREILFETEEFDVTHAESIARPWIYSQLLAAADDPVYAYIIGQQFFNSGKIHEALKFVENAYNKNPESREFGEGLSRIYRELKEHDKIVSLLEPLMRLPESPSFEVHVLLGESYRELGNHEKAIEVFDKAIQLYGVNTLVLNALGGCYFSLGRVSEALSAWEKSLDMNPEQPEIRKNIKPLKKRRRKRIRRKDDKKFVG